MANKSSSSSRAPAATRARRGKPLPKPAVKAGVGRGKAAAQASKPASSAPPLRFRLVGHIADFDARTQAEAALAARGRVKPESAASPGGAKYLDDRAKLVERYNGLLLRSVETTVDSCITIEIDPATGAATVVPAKQAVKDRQRAADRAAKLSARTGKAAAAGNETPNDIVSQATPTTASSASSEPTAADAPEAPETSAESDVVASGSAS